MDRPPRAPPRQPFLPPATALAAALVLVVTACNQVPEGTDREALSPAGESGSEANEQAAAGIRIPRRFQGEWQGDPGACGTAAEARLLIGPDSLRFHESVGSLQALNAEGGRLDVALQLRGEGRTWEATYRFRLSEDGRRLTDLSSGNGMVRLRCA